MQTDAKSYTTLRLQRKNPCLNLLSADTLGSWLRAWDYLSVARVEASQRKMLINLRVGVGGNQSLRGKRARSMGKRSLVCQKIILEPGGESSYQNPETKLQREG